MIDITVSLISRSSPLTPLPAPQCLTKLNDYSAAPSFLSSIGESLLKMDIIEANECLRVWYGRPREGTFDEKDVGVEEGEQWDNSRDEINGDGVPTGLEDSGDSDIHVE